MVQYSEAATKVIREAEVLSKKRQENLEHNLLSELYYFILESEGRKQDSAAELEANMKLEEALENGISTNKIMDLAYEYSEEAREAGFKMGFHIAMKLCMEGMNGGIVL